MVEKRQNLLSMEKLDALEAELKVSLPELYKDEREQQIVSELLIPQFRVRVNEVLEKFQPDSKRGTVLTPPTIQKLCRSIDEVVQENQSLLDTEGLFKPLLQQVQEVRKTMKSEMLEPFQEECREILKAKGIQTMEDLLMKGVLWFIREEFLDYGKGTAFATIILNRTVKYIKLNTLNEIADRLGFKEIPEEEKIQQYKATLAEKGITDRKTLLVNGVNEFIKEKFADYGQGVAFAAIVLNRPIGKSKVTLETLNEIADRLGFKEIPEEEKIQQYKATLAEKGITDRKTLLAKGSHWFKKEDFSPYGKAIAFASEILGEITKDITMATLNKIANKLDFKGISEEESIKQYKAILAEKGIIDRHTFLIKGSEWFKKEDFSPYGKGYTFAKTIVGSSTGLITIKTLENIATILELPEISEQKVEEFRSILFSKGVIDRHILLVKGSEWFRKEDFSPYGKGRAFASLVLGESDSLINTDILHKIADKFGFPQISNAEIIQYYKNILNKKDIIDQKTFLAKGPEWFRKEDFSPYGKGKAFLSRILGHGCGHVTIDILKEVANKLYGRNL